MTPTIATSRPRIDALRARFAEQKRWWGAFEAAATEEVDGVTAYGSMTYRNALNVTLRLMKQELGLPLADEGFVLPWLRNEVESL